MIQAKSDGKKYLRDETSWAKVLKEEETTV